MADESLSQGESLRRKFGLEKAKPDAPEAKQASFIPKALDIYDDQRQIVDTDAYLQAMPIAINQGAPVQVLAEALGARLRRLDELVMIFSTSTCDLNIGLDGAGAVLRPLTQECLLFGNVLREKLHALESAPRANAGVAA